MKTDGSLVDSFVVAPIVRPTTGFACCLFYGGSYCVYSLLLLLNSVLGEIGRCSVV